MIGCFPDPYPDELVYSLLARYYAKSGYQGDFPGGQPPAEAAADALVLAAAPPPAFTAPEKEEAFVP